MPLDASTVIDATTKGIALLQAITEALKKKTPDVPAALSMVNQLQQHIDQLRARNLELERDVLELDKKNFHLQKKVETEETWRAELDKLEKCQTARGKWVFREKGTTQPLYCPSCLNQKKKEFLQNGFHRNFNLDRREEGDYCPICKTSF